MKKSMYTAISGILLGTLMIVSVVGVCTQMLMTCGLDCAAQSANIVHVNENVDGCAHQNDAACAMPVNDHMSLFGAKYPTVAAEMVTFVSVLFLAYAALRFFATRDQYRHSEGVRVKLKSLRSRISRTVSSDLFVHAFSRGILNSKIYA